MTTQAEAARTPGTTAPRMVLIPTARPTFVVEEARARAHAARALLIELGADVVGPDELVMTPADVEHARGYFTADVDVVINVCASFSDATPALELYAGLDRPLVTWSFREPGPVGDRLWLNSLCGANLYGHALTRAGRDVRLLYGDADEPDVRATLTALLAGTYPVPPELPREHGPRASEAGVRRALRTLQGATIGVLGEPPPGFTPSQFDPDLIARVFGLRTDPITMAQAFDRIDAVPAEATEAELAALHRDRPPSPTWSRPRWPSTPR